MGLKNGLSIYNHVSKCEKGYGKVQSLKLIYNSRLKMDTKCSPSDFPAGVKTNIQIFK